MKVSKTDLSLVLAALSVVLALHLGAYAAVAVACYLLGRLTASST